MLQHSSDGTIAALVYEQARLRPDAPAIVASRRPSLGYAAVAEQIEIVAGAVRAAGARTTDRVAIVLDNGPEMATAFLGVAACAACVPLNPGYRADELRFYLQDTRTRAVVALAGESGALPAVVRALGLASIEIETDRDAPAGSFRIAGAPRQPPGECAAPHDTALVLHTSGTTARPKIVPLSQANLVASARNIARHLALTSQDRCLNVMPLFHVHGLVGALLATLAAGGSIVCTTGFDERSFFDSIAEHDPTWYTAVPTIHQGVVAAGARYAQVAPSHRFRFVRSSSAPLSPRTFAQLQALTRAPVIEAYGMTEAAHQIASNPLPPALAKAGSVGLPAGADVALLDGGRVLPAGAVGEIVVRGPGVTAGYESNPAANAEAFSDGWFRTGDLGRLDPDGYLYITGRSKEIVNRGGEKVSPREVDEALLEHAAVAQAVAFAIPHPTLGEDLVAAVVLHARANADEAALRAFLFERLAAFKVPSALVFVDDIPKGPTGKVQRTNLHEKLGRATDKAYAALRDAGEASIEAIFRDVLGGGPFGAHDNFFLLGGDSLKGTQVMSRINAAHALELPVGTLFRHPTIAALSAEVSALVVRRDSEERDIAAEIAQLSDEEVALLLAEEEAALGRTAG